MWSFGVPNVPCGVESVVLNLINEDVFLFLMYRVELKATYNVGLNLSESEFLMYRVELKASTGFMSSQ